MKNVVLAVMFAMSLTSCTNSNAISVKNSRIGVFNGYPKATLDIAGDVRVSQSEMDCTSIYAGTIRWDGLHFQGCDGISWKNFMIDNSENTLTFE